MNQNESAENYLETILILSKTLPAVRSVDVANELNFKKSSISVAMRKLREAGLISVNDSGYLCLTEEGKELAEQVYERHLILSSFLEKLGVDAQTAAADACRIEHVISSESFLALKHFLENNSNK